MGDKEVFMDPERNPNSRDTDRDREYANRIAGAFGSFEKKLGERFTKEEERVIGIREAALKGDKAELEKHLAKTKSETSWLYEELMKHPEISSIMRELAIMGF